MTTIDTNDLAKVSGGGANWFGIELPGAEGLKEWVKPITNWGSGSITNIEKMVVNNTPPAVRSMVEWSKTPEARRAMMQAARPIRAVITKGR